MDCEEPVLGEIGGWDLERAKRAPRNTHPYKRIEKLSVPSRREETKAECSLHLLLVSIELNSWSREGISTILRV